MFYEECYSGETVYKEISKGAGKMRKSSEKQNIRPRIRIKLKAKMIALISILIVGVFIIFALFLENFIEDTMEEQIGKRALGVATSVANIPELREAFQLENPAAVIQDIVAPIRKGTEAEFIVVGNTESVRYSHPSTNHIGKRMVGDDNERALKDGESYVSVEEGSLGLSIRGKAPVFSDEGEIIGVVSVGFLNDDIQKVIADQNHSLWITLFLIILLGVLGAIFISHYIKKLLSNMEPEEISQLMIEKEAILQSTHEGIIAVNNNGHITMMNAQAQQLLFKQRVGEKDYSGKLIQEIIPSLNIQDFLHHNRSFYDREAILGEKVVLINQTPMYNKETIIGTVLTFREKTELEGVIHELSRVKQYANTQRAQTHEFSNKLYTILGLLQLNQNQEAIEFIKKESKLRQKWQRFLTDNIADPLIHAILQGKFNQANELGVNMSIHPDSQLSYRFSEEEKDVLLTALGNLIENAIEAVKDQKPNNRNVSILFTDIGEDVLVEVEDSGPGIAESDIPWIFEQGFSTKNGTHRGIGLALTYQAVQRIEGQLILEEGDLGGACFIMIIPKKGEDTDA